MVTVSMNQLIHENSVLRNLPEHLTAKRELQKYWQEEDFMRMHHYRRPPTEKVGTVLMSTYTHTSDKRQQKCEVATGLII